MKTVTQKHSQDKIIHKRTKKTLDKSIEQLAFEKGHNPKKDRDIDKMINDYNNIFGASLQFGGNVSNEETNLLRLLNKSEQKQYTDSENKYMTL